LALPLASGAASAQGAYPSELVKIIVPYPPGAGIDFLGRLVADKLAAHWNQKVIVENRPGAAGILGTELVARSAPDGYTLVIMPLDVAINPATLARDKSDPIRNLTPIAALSASSQVIAASPKSGVRSIAELIAQAKAEPGKLTFGSCGLGSPGHVIGEWLKQKFQVDMTHVPYKGCAPAVNDALGGHVSIVIGGAGTVASAVDGGLLRGLGVASETRDPQLPELPTLAEAGLPGVTLVNWFSLFGPPNLPPAITGKLYSALQDIYKDDDFKRDIEKRTMKVYFVDPLSFEKTMKRDITEIGQLLQTLDNKSE